MNDKTVKLLDASVAVLARYGIRRATMGDIAKEAGVSRQTLYASFPSKEEMLSATVLHLTQKILKEVRTGWQSAPSLGQKLDVYFQHMVIEMYEMVQVSPDAEDISGKDEGLDGEALAQAGALKLAALEEILAPYQEVIERSGQSLEQLAAFIMRTTKGFGHSASDKQELLSLLVSLRIAVLSVTGEPAQG